MTVHTHRSRSQCNIKSRSPRASRLALANLPQNAKRPSDVGRDGRDDDDDDDDDDDATLNDATPNDANTPVVPSSTHALVPSSSSSLDVRPTDRVDRPTVRPTASPFRVQTSDRQPETSRRVHASDQITGRTIDARPWSIGGGKPTEHDSRRDRPTDRPTARDISRRRPLGRSFGRSFASLVDRVNTDGGAHARDVASRWRLGVDERVDERRRRGGDGGSPARERFGRCGV